MISSGVCMQKSLLRAFGRHSQLRVAAAAESSGSPQKKGSIDPGLAKKIGKIVFIKDNETTADLFSVSGPLIERTHGRLAMWGFLFGAIAELTSGAGIITQIQSSYLSILVTNGLIFLGSMAPKYSAGVSMKDLIEATGSENGTLFIVFNNVYELWLGRVAMLGIVGLIATELVLKGGDALL
eukprot:TRINITY_DN3091_c1_g2_i1.p2 TRINITY_DN3091_c1_g2~~TRINITY_DN3091_c1_g2_i1.p2  ORF type:complete len:182 (-),score=31.18 TRINITY_DN3091_c1_g2_i1:122-667(-)